MLVNNELNLPQPENVPDTASNVPYGFLGDEAFPLQADFLKPFNQRELTPETNVINYFLSRACRVVDNAFGSLEARLKVFHSNISLKPDSIANFVMCCCIQHTYLHTCSEGYVIPQDLEETNR